MGEIQYLLKIPFRARQGRCALRNLSLAVRRLHSYSRGTERVPVIDGEKRGAHDSGPGRDEAAHKGPPASELGEPSCLTHWTGGVTATPGGRAVPNRIPRPLLRPVNRALSSR